MADDKLAPALWVCRYCRSTWVGGTGTVCPYQGSHGEPPPGWTAPTSEKREKRE